MKTRKDLCDYMQGLEKASSRMSSATSAFNDASERYRLAFAPIGGTADGESLRQVYSVCPEGTGYPRSYICVCLVLLLYAPEALYGGKIPLQLAKDVADILCIKHPAVYIARNKITSWLKIYPDFYKLIYGLFSVLTDSASATK